MDFEFSADQEALRHTLARFLAAEAPVRPYVRGMLDHPSGTSEAVWQGLGDLGAFGLLVPEEFGGVGLGMVDAGVVLEEMGRVVHPGPYLSSAIGAVTAVLAAGDHADLERYLPGLAAGTTIGTVALLEEGHGGTWREPSTTARRVGGGWELSGVKAPVADALAADVYFVVAAARGDVGLYAVEAGAPGVTTPDMVTVDGTRRWGRLVLERAPAHRLGATADAAAAIAEVVDRLLVALVTDAVGAAEASLEMAVGYAKERVQFDRPIGSFQAVQHLCADMLQAVEQARAGAYYGLWACDSAAPEERHRAALMAKAFAGDALVGVGAATIQVLGGIGFTWEHDAHLFYKRLMTMQAAYGGTAEHLEALAALVI